MSQTIRAFPMIPGDIVPAESKPHPFLRSFRAQPRRRMTPRLMAMLVLCASLLFVKVWESTMANSLSMERDRLRREVRALENEIRITRDLREQAVLTGGLDPSALLTYGFQSPEPARVIDIDLEKVSVRTGRHSDLASKLFDLLRRIVPSVTGERTGRVTATPVAAEGTR